MRFIITDLETTGTDAAESHVLEWAYAISDGRSFLDFASGLVKPPVPIPPEASAINHIIDSDVAGSPSWQEAAAGFTGTVIKIIESGEPVVLVAHNAEYERAILEKLLPGIPWICTFKAAHRFWPSAPSHSNEGLRYFLGLPARGRGWSQNTHSAAHDAWVTGCILHECLKLGTAEELARWADEPTMLATCPIGKHRGQTWGTIPSDYLSWIVYKATDMRQDVKDCARLELDRRFQR